MRRNSIFAFLLILLCAFANLNLLSPVTSVSASADAETAAAPLSAAIVLAKKAPAAGATGISATSVTLSWSASSTSNVTFAYCLKTTNKCQGKGGKWVKVSPVTVVNGLVQVTITNLRPDTTYYWQIRARDNLTGQYFYGDKGQNDTWSFHTAPLPGSFTKASPLAPNNTDLPINGVVLKWNPTSDTNAHYEYCLNTTSNSVCDKTWVSTELSATPTQVTLNNLSNNAVYSWQVRAVNASGSTLADSGAWWSFSTAVLPNVFNKLSPTADATKQLAKGLTLSWTSYKNATSYEYCISLIRGTCPNNAWTSVVGHTSATVDLAYDTTYYWQVRATSPDGTLPADSDAWWSFHTQVRPPDPFGKAAPLNNAGDQPVTVNLSWNASTGVGVTYEYCYDTLPGTTCDGPWIPVTSGLQITLADLEYSQAYYWQVRAANATDTVYADNGSWWVFTTRAAPSSSFVKDSPQNNSLNQPLNTSLTWITTLNGAYTYQICYDISNDNSCTSGQWLPVTDWQTYAPADLAYGETYYWQVRAHGSTSDVYPDSSAWWHFTTQLQPPGFFSKSAPQNGQPGINAAATLQWGSSDGGSPITYEYCLDAETANNSACDSGWKTAANPAATSVDLSGLPTDMTYWWQVRAKNAGNAPVEADGGAWASFSTVSSQPAASLTKSQPTNGTTTKQPITPWLSWSDLGSGYTYQYCVVKAGSPTCADNAWSTATGVTAQPTLLAGQDYTWQVRASSPTVNGGSYIYSDSSVWWTFSTIPALPVIGDQGFPTQEDAALDAAIAYIKTPGQTLAFYLSGEQPTGLTFNPDGSFHYVPPANVQGQVSFQFVYTDGINPRSDAKTITIDITSQPDSPSLAPITVAPLLAGTPVTFTALGSDPDLPYGDHLHYSILDTQGTTAAIDPISGVFTWTPSQSSVYHFTIRVQDDAGASADQEVLITVLPVIGDQRFSTLEDQALDAAIPYTKIPGATQTFSVSGDQPAGLTFNPDGSFHYLPPADFQGQVTFNIIYTDGVNPPSTKIITIDILGQDDTPMMTPVKVDPARAGRLVSFTIQSKDPDLLYGDQLHYSIVDKLGTNASIDPATGVFTWIAVWSPRQSQYSFTIRVQDDFGASANQVVVITVQPMQTFIPAVVRH